MSETQWTPGPWAVKWETNVFGGERLVAGTGGHTSNISDVEPENRANANLIAAAPELYDALAELKRLLTGADVRILGENIATDIVASIVFDKADRALARARGEETP